MLRSDVVIQNLSEPAKLILTLEGKIKDATISLYFITLILLVDKPLPYCIAQVERNGLWLVTINLRQLVDIHKQTQDKQIWKCFYDLDLTDLL